jgi:hypothetical protein
MRLLTRTTSSDLYPPAPDGSADDGDCSYAVIDIDRDLAKSILEQKELFQMVNSRAPEVCSLEFYNDTARYYSDLEELEHLFEEGTDLDDVRDRVSDCEVMVVRDDVELPDSETVFCDTLVVGERCFYWRCIPKHYSMTIETEALIYEMLLEVVQ